MPQGTPKRVFVLMPFREEFDDVYSVVRDACNEKSVGTKVDCLRADEIEKPGRITDQIIEEIRGADVIIAELTGNNPNVMYELGFAHALGKPTIIINQSIEKSPFDVAGMRQILYDRNRLIKDCRPRLVTSLVEIFGEHREEEEEKEEVREEPIQTRKSAPPKPLAPLALSDRLVASVQNLHLKMQLANSLGNTDGLSELAREVLGMLDRISVIDAPVTSDLRNFVGTVGNCAVELEKAQLFREAEDIWKRAIGLMPTHGGLHFQYGDFLVDRGRIDEAISEAQRAHELSPNDRRVQRLQMKIALTTGKVDRGTGEQLRVNFDKDRKSREAAASLLLFLSRSGAPLDEFERVCKEWEEALPPNEKRDAVRALADHLAEINHYERAKELYENILGGLTGEDRVQVLHNLAIVYDELGNKERAEACWMEAYSLNSSNPIIQAAFSQRLANWGKLDLAVKVGAGAPIP